MPSSTRDVLVTAVAGSVGVVAGWAACKLLYSDPRKSGWLDCGGSVGNGVLAAIGNTPLIRIESLSELTGCDVRPLFLVK